MAPDGEYFLVKDVAGHWKEAKRLFDEKGFSTDGKMEGLGRGTLDAIQKASPWLDREEPDPTSVLQAHGYVRVVFETRTDGSRFITFSTRFRPLDLNLISEAMKENPNSPMATASDAEYEEYKNLADFKARNGMEASITDYLRSGLEVPAHEENAFSAYANSWCLKNCRFAHKSPRSIPFKEADVGSFWGAWLSPSAYANTRKWLGDQNMLWYKQAGFFEEEMLSRNPRSQALSEKLRAMGLVEIGSRSGKAGVQYGIEGKARRISIGARDVMLNYLLVQGRDSRWNMYKSFSLKKVLEHPNIDPVLKGWADWVGRGPTMIEVREKQRERARSDQYASATGLEKSLNQAPQPTEVPPVQPAPDPQLEQPGTERQASKGDPTRLNLWVLKDIFQDKDEVPNGVDPTSVPHLRRCMSAGLVEAVGGRGGTLRLTEKGKQVIRPTQAVPTEQAVPAEPRPYQPNPGDVTAAG